MFDVLPESRSQGAVLRPSVLSTAVFAHGALIAFIVAASFLARVSPGDEPQIPFANDIIIVIPPPLGNSELAGGSKPPVANQTIPPAVTEDLVQPEKMPDAPPIVEPPQPLPSDASVPAPGPQNGAIEGDGTGEGIGPGKLPGIYGQPDGIEGADGPLTPSNRQREDLDRPLIIDGTIREPVALFRAQPEYPEVARRAHVEGVVVLQAVIGTDGRVESVQVLTSVPLLEAAAIKAVRQWRYLPARRGDHPVKVYYIIRIEFTLR
jgi:protein TonB